VLAKKLATSPTHLNQQNQHTTHKQKTIVKGTNQMRPKTGKKNSTGNFFGYTFINYYMPEKVKKGLIQWYQNDMDLPMLLPTVIEAGYKLSISYSDDRAAFTVALTNKNEDSPYHKHILTAHHRDMFKALGEVLYIHHFVAGEDWAVLETQQAEFDW
jgi:hypothetical protein